MTRVRLLKFYRAKLMGFNKFCERVSTNENLGVKVNAKIKNRFNLFLMQKLNSKARKLQFTRIRHAGNTS